MREKISCDPERIPSNLRYIDRKKIRAATVKKTETITATISVLRAAGNICC